MAIFTGAGVAIVTPFKENGEVNFEKFAELINFQVEMVQMRLSSVEQQVRRLLFHMKNISK